MNKLDKYFIFCVVIRLTLAWLIYFSLTTNQLGSSTYVSTVILKNSIIMFYVISSVGLMYHYVTKTRKKGAFGQHIWWDHMRPIHALLFLLISYFLYINHSLSYKLAILDTIIGIGAYMYVRHLI
jgi:phosphate/sulfate permease